MEFIHLLYSHPRYFKNEKKKKKLENNYYPRKITSIVKTPHPKIKE